MLTDDTTTDNHCTECGEYESECTCDEHHSDTTNFTKPLHVTMTKTHVVILDARNRFVDSCAIPDYAGTRFERKMGEIQAQRLHHS